jgi:predicted transposase/invertase (TIGR01784 family)
LVPEQGSFIDAQLAGAESDRLFSVKTSWGLALIYMLVEHQSAPDRHMPLRLLRYIGRILDAHRRRAPDAPLPPVLPVVLYHAERPWPYPTRMASLYSVNPLPTEWSRYMIDFDFVLDDLATTPSLELAARPVSPLVALALFLLKRARYAPNLLEELEQISPVFDALERSSAPDEQRSALFMYTWAVGHVEVSEMSEFVRQHAWPKLQGAAMTTAEKLHAEGWARGLEEGRAQGLEEGEERGRAQGLAHTLWKLMRTKFHDLTPELEQRIQAADLAQLEGWLDRVLLAECPEDVLGDS